MEFGSAFNNTPMPPSLDERMANVADSLEHLIALLAGGRPLPRPTPTVDTVEMVNAVVGLKGPATASEIAEALAARLAPSTPASDAAGVLAAVDKLAQTLDHRLRGLGQAFGSSGTVNVNAEIPFQIRDPANADHRLGVDASGRLTIANAFATEATLSTRASEATLLNVRDRLPAALHADGGINVHLVNIPPELDEFTVLASAARTATFTGDAFTNPRHLGMRLYLNISAASGTLPTLDVKMQTQDSVSGNWVDVALAAFPQLSAPGLSVLVVYPGINQTTVGTTARVSNVMSRRWRLVHTIAGTAPSFTYSVGGLYLP